MVQNQLTDRQPFVSREMTERDLKAVRDFGARVDVEEFVTGFYDWLKPRPEYEQFFSEPETRQRVRDFHISYWKDFFQANIDDDYIAKRVRIGETLARLQVGVHQYFYAITFYKSRLNALVLVENLPAQESFVTLSALIKLTQFDQSIVLDTMSAQVTQELNRRAEDLARSNAELQQFAYSASHDLKEPLRTVKIYMQMLERKFHGKLDAEEEKYFGFVLDASTRLEALIHDLLEIARIETQAKPFQPTNLEEVFQTAVNSLDAAITTHGAVVTHDPLPVVMGDSVQLGQLFQNLIGNAVKFYDERPPEVNVAAEQKQDQWIIAIRDNGIGIDPEHLDQIFTMFKRLHARDEYSGGTGVGLALCKKIVERHGGRIWVESKPGNGATFYFTIPV